MAFFNNPASKAINCYLDYANTLYSTKFHDAFTYNFLQKKMDEWENKYLEAMENDTSIFIELGLIIK